jgi:hypothetical protein
VPNQMQLYVIAPSPLVKICLPEWESRLAADPNLLLDDKTPFEFEINTGSNTYKIPFDTPVSIIYDNTKYIASKEEFFPQQMGACKIAPKKMRNDIIRVRDPMELENVFIYLTGVNGGMSARQTDPYGIVPFDPDNEIAVNYEEKDLIEDILSTDPKIAEAAKKRLVASRMDMAKKRKESLVKLRNISEDRIKNHLRHKHNNLISQWRKNEEMKLGKYPPSVAEIMGFKVLDPEIRAKDDATAEAARMGNEMLNRPMMGA